MLFFLLSKLSLQTLSPAIRGAQGKVLVSVCIGHAIKRPDTIPLANKKA